MIRLLHVTFGNCLKGLTITKVMAGSVYVVSLTERLKHIWIPTFLGRLRHNPSRYTVLKRAAR